MYRLEGTLKDYDNPTVSDIENEFLNLKEGKGEFFSLHRDDEFIQALPNPETPEQYYLEVFVKGGKSFKAVFNFSEANSAFLDFLNNKLKVNTTPWLEFNLNERESFKHPDLIKNQTPSTNTVSKIFTWLPTILFLIFAAYILYNFSRDL